MEQVAKSPKANKIKDKKIIGAIVAVVLILLLVVVGALALKGSTPKEEDDSMSFGSDLPTLTPEDVGLEVTVRDDGRALMFELTKADDIQKVEYTIEYEAETDEGTANQGIFGEMNIGEDGITKTDFREFGTCSAGKCRYDKVASDITINLKVTKKNGKEYSVQKVVKIPQSEK